MVTIVNYASLYIIADPNEDHPLIASDPPDFILPDRDKVQGLDRMFYGPGCDDPFPLEDHKDHCIGFRVWGNHLPVFKAYKDDIRTCGGNEVFLFGIFQ